jgi:hypothetical protein
MNTTMIVELDDSGSLISNSDRDKTVIKELTFSLWKDHIELQAGQARVRISKRDYYKIAAFCEVVGFLDL